MGHHAALARQQDAVGRVQEQEDVAVRHGEHEHEDLGHSQQPQALQDVGPWRGHHQQHGQRHADPDAGHEDDRADDAGDGRGNLDWTQGQLEEPRSGHQEERRDDHDPGEEGDAEPDAPDEERKRHVAGSGGRQGDRIQRRQDGQRPGQAGGQDDGQKHAELGARVDLLEEAGLARVLLGEDGVLDRPGDPPEGLLEPADAPFALARLGGRLRGRRLRHTGLPLVRSGTASGPGPAPAPSSRERPRTTPPMTRIPTMPAIS